jgi:hypothetical protein
MHPAPAASAGYDASPSPRCGKLPLFQEVLCVTYPRSGACIAQRGTESVLVQHQFDAAIELRARASHACMLFPHITKPETARSLAMTLVSAHRCHAGLRSCIDACLLPADGSVVEGL